MTSSTRPYLEYPVEHVDPTSFNAVPIVEAMERMAFQARNLARGCRIVQQMVKDQDCTVILCVAGSLVSAGLKKALLTLVETNSIDCVVSTGANMVDMDFLEALGFRHYIGDSKADDAELRELGIDRIYDTFICEDELRVCDATVSEIADRLSPKPHSSREFLAAMGAYLEETRPASESIVRVCYSKGVPIFVPSLSDSSAGFGLTFHQQHSPQDHVSHDSVRDFSELTRIVSSAGTTAMLVLGGGVPKNFTADTVVCADVLGLPVKMHKYAVQVTVADERDGALSGSTLREAHSWGKVDAGSEQMIFAEATLALPLIVSYVYHTGDWRQRREKRWNDLFDRIQLRNSRPDSPGAVELRRVRHLLR